MANYDWRLFAEGPAAARYPDWVEGGDEWREAAGGSDAVLDTLLDRLAAARAAVQRGEPGTGLNSPRLFISHRHRDEARAREVAVLAELQGFQVWLDVLDPAFQGRVRPGPTYQPLPRELAVFIEIALLNSTHVIALITGNTRGTMWMPYEYGRVKDPSVDSGQAACWIDSDVTDAPEYLELGVVTRTDDEIKAWLQQEVVAWVKRYPATAAPVPAAVGRRPLTVEEFAVIADRLRHGHGKELPAPRLASFKNKQRPPLDL